MMTEVSNRACNYGNDYDLHHQQKRCVQALAKYMIAFARVLTVVAVVVVVVVIQFN